MGTKTEKAPKTLIPARSPKSMVLSTLEDVLQHYAAGGIQFALRDGGQLGIRDPEKIMPGWLRDWTRHHKDALTRLADRRAKKRTIERNLTALRFAAGLGERGREQSLLLVHRQLCYFEAKLATIDDPEDVFSDGDANCLWANYAELIEDAGRYPIPMDDPRPRTSDGMLKKKEG
ncbi:MAG: hypothetical protein ABIY70_18225 [Capsulimonas sp.]|uniref:hypothetical protein n=1 Tax=Capsulimonas sp. TaxID=2494211 RepID=UPI003263C56A